MPFLKVLAARLSNLKLANEAKWRKEAAKEKMSEIAERMRKLREAKERRQSTPAPATAALPTAPLLQAPASERPLRRPLRQKAAPVT